MLPNGGCQRILGLAREVDEKRAHCGGDIEPFSRRQCASLGRMPAKQQLGQSTWALGEKLKN
jgi:hypothetical protein